MIIDLTMLIEDDMPVFKGDPKVTLKPIATIKEDGYSNYMLSSSMHVGTHVDGAAHMLINKPLMDEYKLEDLIGLARYVSDDVIYENQGESLLVVKMKSSSLNDAFTQAIIDAKIKLIVIDKASVDNDPYNLHKRLFYHDILIVENAVNLDALDALEHFMLYVIPLRIKADSSPVRVFVKTL